MLGCNYRKTGNERGKSPSPPAYIATKNGGTSITTSHNYICFDAQSLYSPYLWNIIPQFPPGSLTYLPHTQAILSLNKKFKAPSVHVFRSDSYQKLFLLS